MLFDSPPSDWRTTTLGEICREGGGDIQTGPFGSQLHASDYVDAGIPSIMPANIKDGRVVEDGIARITQSDSKRLSKYLVAKGDIVYSRRGDVERCALIREKESGWLCGTGCLRVRPGADVIDSDFCAHFLSHPEIREWISRHAVGATMPNLNTRILSEVPILLPPKREQKAIAHILGTLDDKIELNRKTNETLEAMAKALFKSWFVDFDPVRAKAEDRSTGLPAEISDLFPDSFEDSELGEIPSGWRCSPLAERVIYLSRGISPAYCEEGGVLVLNQKCIRDSRVSFEKARRHDTTRKQIIGREVRRFDALVNSTGVGTLGRVAMMPTCQEEVVVDSHVTVVRGSNDQESFFISSTLLNRQVEIEALGEGSTGQAELSRVVLGSLPVIFPSSQLISAYFDSAYAIQDKIEKNEEASVALASTRDALLPKLISGEIRIPDVEKMLEEVGI